MWQIMPTASTAALIVYCLCSLFVRARISTGWKLAGALLICSAALKWEWFRILGGSPWRPELPRWLWLLLEGAFNSLIALACFLVLIDFVHLVALLVRRKKRPAISWKLLKAWSVGLAIAAGIWGTWEAIKVPDVKIVSFQDASLPAELEGFKIIQLSDLHIQDDTPDSWLAGVVEKANARQPDLIVLTGDIADGYPERMENKVAPLASLRAKYGVFGVSGNHERYWQYTDWMRELRKLGVAMLENSAVDIEVNGKRINIFGVRDPGHSPKNFILPEIPKNNGADFVLALAHQPLVASRLKDRASLILSGHTHGGHILPLIPLVKALNGGMASGWYDNIYVSAGTGLWRGFSFRLGAAAEISEILLKR